MPSPITNLSRLAIHTMTTRPWSIETAVAKYAQAGVSGITVWRQWLEGRAPHVVLVCGAVPALSLEENRRQITDGIAACTDHAASVGVKLAIEPLHPMYAGDRSAVNTLGQANDMIDEIGGAWTGIAADVYHLWWDPDLERQIRRAGRRILGFHVCDWLCPTTDLLLDRGLMGEGCIDIPRIRGWVEETGFADWIEVEVFSNRWWATDQDAYLDRIKAAYIEHV